MNCFYPDIIHCFLFYWDCESFGNKVVKFKVSAFYFVLGNIPANYWSRLNDINLLLMSSPALAQKYGYNQPANTCSKLTIKILF